MGSICAVSAESRQTSPTKPSPILLTKENYTQTPSISLQINECLSPIFDDLPNDEALLRLKIKRLTVSILLKYLRSSIFPTVKSRLSTWRNVIILDRVSYRRQPSQIYEQYDNKEENEDIEVSHRLLTEAEEMINSENLIVLKQNPLNNFNTSQCSEAKPIELLTVFRFCEEMLDKKYDVDLVSLKTNRPPESIPDFFINYLNRYYGLKKLAQNFMSQILVSLKNLYDENHSYAKTMCKLLQIYDPDPIPTQLAVFLTKARSKLQSISGKKQQKGSTKLDEVHLDEAMKLIYALLETDKFSRSRALLYLKPSSLTEEEYLMFRIGHKINRMGLTVENVFSKFDSEDQGYITKFQLYRNLMSILELSLSNEDVEALDSMLDLNNTDLITPEEFSNSFSTKFYLENKNDKSLIITRYQFFEALIQTYKIVQIKDTALLTHLFQDYNKPMISRDDFSAILLKLDSKLSCTSIDSYFASLQTDDPSSEQCISLESLISCVFKYAIGRRGLRDFSNPYLDLTPTDLDLPEEKKSPFKSEHDLSFYMDASKSTTPTSSNKRFSFSLGSSGDPAPPMRPRLSTLVPGEEASCPVPRPKLQRRSTVVAHQSFSGSLH